MEIKTLYVEIMVALSGRVPFMNVNVTVSPYIDFSKWPVTESIWKKGKTFKHLVCTQKDTPTSRVFTSLIELTVV